MQNIVLTSTMKSWLSEIFSWW